jgi:hypothetical protein
LNPTNIVDSNHWLQNQNQYDTIDLSCFDVIYGGAFATFDDLDSYGTKNFTITLKNQTKKTTIDNGAFNSCTKIIDFILPNSEVSIGSNTFGNCKNLKKITAGSSTDVTSLGTGSFMNCESLEEIDFTNSTLTTLATSAFQNCKNLKMIKLPSTCTIFNYSTLSNCTNLTDLYYRADSAPSIYSGGAFFDVAEGGTLHINATYAKTLGKTTGNAVTEWNGLTK